MDISIVHAFHPSLQCSLENSNVYETLLRPVSIFLRYQQSKIKKKFFVFRLLIKLIFRMKIKMICLMIAQKTMASQIMRVILIQHPQKEQKHSASTKRAKAFSIHKKSTPYETQKIKGR